MKFVLKRCAARTGGPFDQLLLLFLEHFVGYSALAISLHQFAESASRFRSQEARRQIETGLVVEIFDDLRFLSPIDLMLFFVLEIVLDHVAKFAQRFVRQQFWPRRRRPRQGPSLLDLLQRNRVGELSFRPVP